MDRDPNITAHTSAVITAKLVELDYDLLPYTRYSPDDSVRFPYVSKHEKVTHRNKVGYSQPTLGTPLT